VFSVSPAELATIGVVALLVFGPKRLPEIARKAGRIARELRVAAQDLKSGIEEEYRDTIEPIEEAGREMRAALGDLKQTRMATPQEPSARPPEDASGNTAPDDTAPEDTAPEDTAPEEDPAP
jgi:TatA/E family protein of Tat protein translocase